MALMILNAVVVILVVRGRGDVFAGRRALLLLLVLVAVLAGFLLGRVQDALGLRLGQQPLLLGSGSGVVGSRRRRGRVRLRTEGVRIRFVFDHLKVRLLL